METPEQPWEGTPMPDLVACGIKATEREDSLGTIGAGNHFTRRQKVEAVLDPQRFDLRKLNSEHVVLLVHIRRRLAFNYWRFAASVV
jgi:RNA-splicing ligase RtcB